MKHGSLLFIMSCIVATAAVAQQKADIKVHYIQDYNGMRGGRHQNSWVLIANPVESKFYNPQAERIDSMCSSADGKKKYDTMMFQAISTNGQTPTKPTNLYVFTSSEQSNVAVYDKAVEDFYFYEEPLDEMTWEISDSTRKELDYDCLMATSDYHGRKWTAWFTPDIPISAGPWKFRGVPGLILEVYDADGDYRFVADAIEKADIRIYPIYSEKQYSREDRKEMLRVKRRFVENPLAHLEAQFGKMEQIDGDGIQNIQDGWVYLETDFR